MSNRLTRPVPVQRQRSNGGRPAPAPKTSNVPPGNAGCCASTGGGVPGQPFDNGHICGGSC